MVVGEQPQDDPAVRLAALVSSAEDESRARWARLWRWASWSFLALAIAWLAASTVKDDPTGMLFEIGRAHV